MDRIFLFCHFYYLYEIMPGHFPCFYGNVGVQSKIFPPLMNKFITGCRKSNYLFYSVDGDISPCLFL